MTFKTQSILDGEEATYHLGHNLTIVMYGEKQNYSLECEDCNQTLQDWEVKA